MNRVNASRVSALAMVLVVAIGSPWLFGSVQPWAQLFCLTLAGCACCFAIWLPRWKHQPAVAWILLSILAISVGQLVAFSPGFLKWLSPNAVSLRVAFGLSGVENYAISLDPAVTRNAIANLIGVVICFLVSTRLATPRLLVFALSLIALNGVCLAVVGIWQKQFYASSFYGAMGGAIGWETSFGPFVNRNNAAGFLLLSLSAAFVLLIVSLRDVDFGKLTPAGSQVFLGQAKAALTGRPLVPLIATVFIICGIFSGQSRGGILALLTGIVCTLCLALQRKHFFRATFIATAIAIGAAALLIVVNKWNPVSERVGAVFDQAQAARDGRLSIWKSCVGYFSDFAFAGSGLGTFGHVFRLYDIDADGTTATHAENLFVQVACEGGILIFILLVVAAVLQFRSAALLLVNRHLQFSAVGVAWTFMLISQLIASCFDFGLLIPANMYLLAVLSGLYSGMAMHSRRRSQSSAEMRLQKKRESTLQLSGRIGVAIFARRFDLVSVGLLLLALMCSIDLVRTSSLESIPTGFHQTEWGRSGVAETPTNGDEDQTELSRLLRNIRFRNDDAKAHFAIAEAYIAKFESQTSELVGDEGKSIKLHAVASRIQQLFDRDGSADVKRILASALVEESLQPAYAHLIASRRACCLDPNVHLRLSHLSFMDTSNARAANLERMIRLYEGKRHQSYVDGLVRYEAGDLEEALEKWKPCLNSLSRYRGRVIDFALSSAKLDDLLKNFFPLSERFLVELADKHLSEPGQRESKEIVLQMAQKLKK